jgi:hypothetical protein
MKALKTTLSVTLLILFAGCATVTDANVDLPEDNNTVISVERAGDTCGTQETAIALDPIRGDRPDMGE